jgi:hypothetical protein
MRTLKPFATITLGLVLALFTTGCFTVDMLIKVRPDGSGEVELVSTVKKGFIEQFAAMAGVEGEGGVEALFSEAKLQETGDSLGPGVKLVRHELIKTETEEGVRAFYTFTDIGALRPEVMSAAPGGGSAGDGDQQGVDFSFQQGTKGAPSVITAAMPQPDLKDSEKTAAPAAGEDGAAPAMDPAQLAMISQMFAGLKVQIVLEVEGKLLKSNAPKVTGNRSTLLAIDFDQILAAPDKLGLLMANEPSSLADLQKITADIPGLVIPTEPELRIEFQ